MRDGKVILFGVLIFKKSSFNFLLLRIPGTTVSRTVFLLFMAVVKILLMQEGHLIAKEFFCADEKKEKSFHTATMHVPM